MTDNVTLEADESATLETTRLISATVSWTSDTDYELLALVLLRDGTVEHVSTFDAKGVPAQPDFRGLVRHLGDHGRGHVTEGGGSTSETIEIVPDPSIAAVVPFAYSAMNNGLGSFDDFHVTMTVDDGAGNTVTVDVAADEEDVDDDLVFTCVPAVIYLNEDDVVVQRSVLFSSMGSERRPAARLLEDGGVEITMDAGPKNIYKSDPTHADAPRPGKWWRRAP